MIDGLDALPIDEAESDRTYSGCDGFTQAKEKAI